MTLPFSSSQYYLKLSLTQKRILLKSDGYCYTYIQFKSKEILSYIVKLGSCSSLLKSLNSTLKVSIQNQKEQSWR